MVVETSALIAIFLGEPESDAFARSITESESRFISAVSKLEAGMVAIGRAGVAGQVRLDLIIRELDLVVVPFDDQQADIAREALARYGKGRHRAGLNFGDCAAYALAISEAEPLLFKGTDFGATDVQVVTV
jgi:ribonuclease VapC